VNGGALERFPEGQWWKDAGQTASKHRLARARRTDKQKVVTSRRRDFERAAWKQLPAYVGKISLAPGRHHLWG
jgi:hypothetical protein